MSVDIEHKHHHRGVNHPARHHAAHHDAPAPLTSTYLKGVDVSHHDGTVDWSKVKAAGIEFAFAKSSEGLHFTDPTFSTNWSGMKAAGIVRGAYHFGRPHRDAVTQAQRLFDAAGADSGDLPLTLDLEKSDGLSKAKVWAWAQDFLAKIQSLTGKPAFFYSYGPFWQDDMGNHTDNLNCPLWLADYRHRAHVPRAWTDWTIWQYTSKGKVAGIHTHVDRNYYKGTLTELKALAYT